MAKSAAPLFILGGGLALLMLTKKKSSGDNGIELPPLVPEDELEELSPEERCSEFLNQLYVEPTETGEMPIEEVAVEQQIIPEMREAAQAILKSEGVLNPDYHGNIITTRVLSSLIPHCEWSIADFEEGEIAELISPDDERARKIYTALVPLAIEIAKEEKPSIKGMPSEGPKFDESPPEKAKISE